MPWAPVVQDDILLRQVFFYLQSFFLCNQSLFSLCHFSSCPFHLCVPVSCCKMLPLGSWNPDEIFRFVNNELFFNGAVNLVVDNRIVLIGWRSDPYYFIMNLVGRRGCYLLRINICVKRARRRANGKNSIRLIPRNKFYIPTWMWSKIPKTYTCVCSVLGLSRKYPWPCTIFE